MSKSVSIPFKRKNIGSTVFNCLFVFIGIWIVNLAFSVGENKSLVLFLIGCVFFLVGLHWLTKGNGIQVNKDKHRLILYGTSLGLKKRKASHSIDDIEKILVSTGTAAYGRSSLLGSKSSVSFKVFKLSLVPTLQYGKDRIEVGVFYTQKECMEAAEALTKASGLSLELRIR